MASSTGNANMIIIALCASIFVCTVIIERFFALCYHFICSFIHMFSSYFVGSDGGDWA